MRLVGVEPNVVGVVIHHVPVSKMIAGSLGQSINGLAKQC